MKTDFENDLKEWSARHSPGTKYLDHLRGRIVVEAARRHHLGQSLHMPWQISPWGRAAFSVLGACAGILILLMGWGYFWQTSAPETGASLAGLTKPSAAQMGAFQKLFAETTRLFPKQLRWIVQSNGDVGLGVESEGSGQVSDTPAMVVRLVLVKRASGEKDWKPAWTTDIVMRGEDWVEITSDRKGDNKLTLWVYPLEKGMVAVDTSIALDHPMRISGRLDTVIGIGQPAGVAISSRDGNEYKLFQTVQPLTGRQGCKS